MAGGTSKFSMLVSLKTKGQAGLKRMGNAMQGLQGRLKNVRMAALSVNTAFRAMAVILTAGAFSKFITGAIDQADAFGKLSRQTGIAADELQSYVNAGKLAGVEQSSIEKSLRRLSQSMHEADQEVATYADAYKALGISVRGSDGNLKDSEVVLAEIADRFRDMPDGATKAALAMEIFGRSGSQIIPMLNEGGKALNEWNYQTSEKFAQNAEYFNDQVTMLGFGFDGFRKQLADAVLPALNSIMEVFREIFSSTNDWELFFDVIGGGLRGIAAALLAMIQLMEETIKLFGAFFEMGGKILKGDFGGAMESGKGYAGGVSERFAENMERYNKIFFGESEAGESYFQEGTRQAAELETQLTRTFGGGMLVKIEKFKESMMDVGGQVADVVISAFKKMEDALVEFVMTGKLQFKDFANSIIRDMIRIAIQQSITAPLAGMFGNLVKGATPAPSVPGRAAGGPVGGGQSYLGGERGPEIFTPKNSGHITPNNAIGGTSIVVNVDASGSSVQGSEQEGNNLGQLIASAVKGVLISEKRPGGLLAT